jgi:aryl-alcohol dehydrogenase-like predicted oxidoreductase
MELPAEFLVSYEAGIQTFDTADMYSNGESERVLGKAAKQPNLPRDKIVVMTKVFKLIVAQTTITYRNA